MKEVREGRKEAVKEERERKKRGRERTKKNREGKNKGARVGGMWRNWNMCAPRCSYCGK